MFKKKKNFKQKKSEWDFQFGTPRQARQAERTNSPWKIIEVTHLRKSGRGRGIGVINILLKHFFFKIPDLVHRRTLAPVAAGNRRYMALQTS